MNINLLKRSVQGRVQIVAFAAGLLATAGAAFSMDAAFGVLTSGLILSWLAVNVSW